MTSEDFKSVFLCFSSTQEERSKHYTKVSQLTQCEKWDKQYRLMLPSVAGLPASLFLKIVSAASLLPKWNTCQYSLKEEKVYFMISEVSVRGWLTPEKEHHGWGPGAGKMLSSWNLGSRKQRKSWKSQRGRGGSQIHGNPKVTALTYPLTHPEMLLSPRCLKPIKLTINKLSKITIRFMTTMKQWHHSLNESHKTFVDHMLGDTFILIFGLCPGSWHRTSRILLPEWWEHPTQLLNSLEDALKHLLCQ